MEGLRIVATHTRSRLMSDAPAWRARSERTEMISSSSSSGMSSKCSSKKRFRKARESNLRPPYNPGGFCVANNIKCGCGLTICCVSGMNNSRLSSNKRFNASRTSEGARFNSSNTTQ